MRRTAAGGLLAAAAVAYVLAAWRVAPGFYDGFSGPPDPYRWVSPPAQFVKGNRPPGDGQLAVRVNRGVSEPGSAFTSDGQAVLSFVPGVFAAPPDGSAITVTIKPVADFPSPDGSQFASNVYLISSTSQLVKEAIVTLRYTDQLPAPSDVFFAPAGGPWRDIGSTGTSAPYTVTGRTTALGYFTTGYPPKGGGTASAPRVGGGNTLPILVAAAILMVLLAGFPLALLRRRRG